MNDKFNSFFKQVNGIPQEAEDPSNKFQCFDLAFKWVDYLSIPRESIRHFYAYQIFTQPNDQTRKYFDIVYNGPNNTPVVGDIVVFGTQIGYAGHVAIATANSNGLNCLTLDQNWNGLLYPRLITHYNYYGVLGWLHPKTAQTGTVMQQIHDIIYSSQADTQKVLAIQAIVPK